MRSNFIQFCVKCVVQITYGAALSVKYYRSHFSFCLLHSFVGLMAYWYVISELHSTYFCKSLVLVLFYCWNPLSTCTCRCNWRGVFYFSARLVLNWWRLRFLPPLDTGTYPGRWWFQWRSVFTVFWRNVFLYGAFFNSVLFAVVTALARFYGTRLPCIC